MTQGVEPTFALRLGSAAIFWRDAQPSRVGELSRATHFPDVPSAEVQAGRLGLAWRVVPVAPVTEGEAR